MVIPNIEMIFNIFLSSAAWKALTYDVFTASLSARVVSFSEDKYHIIRADESDPIWFREVRQHWNKHERY